MIEPTWYMPIIPSVLVNGNCFVPCYNPRDIVANVRRLLNGESMVPMKPWYRGFKGTIEETASSENGSRYTVAGMCEEVDDTTIRITELPIRTWTDDYKGFLRSLKRDNVPFLKNNIWGICCESVDLEFKLSEENMMLARQEGLLEIFKLTKTITTNNMRLFDQTGVIKKYATPEQIIEEFFNLRLQYYEERKKMMLCSLELEMEILKNKARFVHEVHNGDIIIIKRNIVELDEELRQRGFKPFPKKSTAVYGAIDASSDAPSSTMIPDSKYGYLYSLGIRAYFLETFEELCADRDRMSQVVEDLKIATPKSLRLRDLESLDRELDVIDMKLAEAEE